MSKHVIIATETSPEPGLPALRYFFGYRDDGASFEPLWTYDPWKANWIDAAEAEIELMLLANICPGAYLDSWSLDVVGSPRAR